jgi:hypothetical protein
MKKQSTTTKRATAENKHRETNRVICPCEYCLPPLDADDVVASFESFVADGDVTPCATLVPAATAVGDASSTGAV